jgi:predicted acetyltransferase
VTSVEIRTCEPEQLSDALAPIWHYFGSIPKDEDVEQLSTILPAERVYGAFDDGRIVGGAGSYLFGTTVPGGRVPTAGVMAVGVLPTHRRRGILSRLMRQQLDEAHERGEPLATLYASEGAIYRRYGYGPASISGSITLDRNHAALHEVPPAGAQARLVTKDEALELFPRIYDRIAAETPGMLDRSREWWEVRRLAGGRFAKGEQMRLLLELEGDPQGYAIYRIEFSAERVISHSVLQISEAIGATPAATRDLWRVLLDIDWIETIRADFLPPDHPLFLLLTEPRRMAYTAGEALWARLIDVGAALSARSYASDGNIVLEVSDEFCPWNDCRWRVAVDCAERTDAEADLRLGVDMLGSTYLGGFTFAQLARAGRVEELREGAIERADALFRTDRLPWCPEIF